MMIIVNNIDNKRIVGTASGEAFSVMYSEPKYKLMKDLETKADEASTVEELKAVLADFLPLTKESYKTLIESACDNVVVNPYTNQFFLRYNDVVSNRPMPFIFADRLIKSAEKGLDFTPYLKLWVRYLRPSKGRPAYSEKAAQDFAEYIGAVNVNRRLQDKYLKEGLSLAAATEKATRPQVSITKEGLIVGYKVSREIVHKYALNEEEEVVSKSRYTKTVDPDTGEVTYDEPKFSEDLLFEPVVMGNRGDEFNCVSLDGSINKKGHHIRVGCRHFLDSWDQVSTPGHKGLHCGGLSYIDSYQTEGTVTHNIFIDPAHIHTVLNHSDCALTCLEYFVHSSFKGEAKTLYNSSSYASFHDTLYQDAIKEVVDEAVMAREEADALVKRAEALK